MRDAKKTLTITVLVTLLFGLALLYVLVRPSVSEGNASGVSVVAVDASGSPSPDASPSVEPSPSAEPIPQASSATVKWAQKQRRNAHRAWRKYQRAAGCFGKRVVPFLSITPKPPTRAAAEDVWRSYGQRWQHKRQQFVKKYNSLRQKMLHPGGSSNGVRWMPLARWVGWPESTLGNLAYIIMRESSGRERAYNSVIGCTGLLQIWPGHVSDPANLFHAEYNLTVGLRLYHQCGWSPWAL